jgi:NAD/NADP transhydrogenase beta subunit
MHSALTVAYIGAAALFILSLAGLSHPETARRGNWFGIAGMVIALVATAFNQDESCRPARSRSQEHAVSGYVPLR